MFIKITGLSPQGNKETVIIEVGSLISLVCSEEVPDCVDDSTPQDISDVANDNPVVDPFAADTLAADPVDQSTPDSSDVTPDVPVDPAPVVSDPNIAPALVDAPVVDTIPMAVEPAVPAVDIPVPDPVVAPVAPDPVVAVEPVPVEVPPVDPSVTVVPPIVDQSVAPIPAPDPNAPAAG